MSDKKSDKAATFFGVPLEARGNYYTASLNEPGWLRVRLTPPDAWSGKPDHWLAVLSVCNAETRYAYDRDPHHALRRLETKTRQLLDELAGVVGVEVED